MKKDDKKGIDQHEQRNLKTASHLKRKNKKLLTPETCYCGTMTNNPQKDELRSNLRVKQK